MKTALSAKFNAKAILLAFIVSALGAITWSVDLTQAAAAPSATAPAPANFHAFMLAVVGPAAAPIWDGGYAAKLTDQDWERIRQAATNLTASVSTISSGGTVAAEQARAKSAVWQEWTKKLSGAATAAKNAADSKAQPALATAGDNLVEICEGCHMAFDPTAK